MTQIGIFGRQLLRSKRRLASMLLLLVAVTTFFVMSLNLYSNSVRNLAYAAEAYRTIAIMELYGDVDQRGDLVTPGSESHEGYLSVAVGGYDLNQILQADGVIGYDLRAKYGAYIEGETAMQHDTSDMKVDNIIMASEDIIRFKIMGNQPITIPLRWSEDYKNYRESISLSVLESAAGCYWYRSSLFSCSGISMGYTEEARAYYADQVKALNRSEEVDCVVLYPGVEYIAGTWMTSGWHKTEDSKGLLVGSCRFYPSYMDYFGQDFYVNYGKTEYVDFANGKDADQPFPIARWEDVQADPILRELWSGAWDAMKYNTCAYTVCLTDDITGVPVFHLGGAFLADGRMITAEEYTNGAKVCMISKEMAELQRWYVGDKLDMDLFRFDAFPNSNTTPKDSQPVYHKNTEGFFDSGEYEIVGIFDQKALSGNSGISQSTLTMPWNTIYVPRNSVQNAPPEEELPVHGALLTVWLENGSIDDFLADMDALGITEAKDGQYTPAFTFYDQGYSVIQPSLQSLHSTAKLLLVLSTLLLLVTCVLLAFLFAQKEKHNVGVFRMLGGTKKQAVAAILACTVVITVAAAMPGTIVGHTLSTQIGDRILASDRLESEKTAALRAYVLAAEETSISVAARADPKVSVLAGVAAMLFPLLVLVFMTGYIGKEPRELLPKNKA